MSFPQESQLNSDESGSTSDNYVIESDGEEVSQQGIQPYQFEPECSAVEENIEATKQTAEFQYVEDEPRRRNLDWYVYIPAILTH